VLGKGQLEEQKPALAGDRSDLRRGATIEFSPAFQGREGIADFELPS